MKLEVTPAIEMLPIGTLRPYARNARTHSKKQLNQIAESITRFGFTNPVLVSDELEIIAGHGRVLAAQSLGIEVVPTIRLSHLSADERRAYVLADNKLAENAGWDIEILSIELQALADLDFDLELSGFSLAEIDFMIEQGKKSAPDEAADQIPELERDPLQGSAICGASGTIGCSAGTLDPRMTLRSSWVVTSPI